MNSIWVTVIAVALGFSVAAQTQTSSPPVAQPKNVSVPAAQITSAPVSTPVSAPGSDSAPEAESEPAEGNGDPQNHKAQATQQAESLQQGQQIGGLNPTYREMMPNFNWPDASYDPKKLVGDMTPEQIKAKALEFKRKILKQYCREMAARYEEATAKDEKFSDIGFMYQSICSRFDWNLDHSTSSDSYFFEIPNAVIIRKMDILKYEFSVSPGKRTLKRAEEYDKAYQASLFAKIGIPLKQGPMVTQILLLVCTLFSLIAAIKALFG